MFDPIQIDAASAAVIARINHVMAKLQTDEANSIPAGLIFRLSRDLGALQDLKSWGPSLSNEEKQKAIEKAIRYRCGE